MRACATACFIVGLSAAGQAQAQSQAPEPPATQAPVSVPEGSVPESSVPQGSAIFGAAEGRGLAARTERVDLVIQVFGGYDDDVLAEGSGGAPNQRRLSSSAAGLATGVGAAITYSRPGLLVNRPGAKGDFKAIADSSIRYYPGLGNLTGQYHRFGLQLSAPVNRRLTLYASPRADYSPRYAFELLSGPLPADPESAPSTFTSEHAPAPAVDYSVVANNSFRYGAVGGAELRLGTQSSLTVDGGYTKRRSDIAAFDMEVRNAGVSFEHRFTRSAGLELGYSYIDGNNASALATRAHNIDIGIDYRRPLSQTRRTFVSFNTGSTVAESEIGGRRMQAIGSASLVHYIKRTWTALVEYRRRLHYVEGFDRPLFGDAVTTGFNGLLSRQMELVVRASYTNGSVGVRANAPRFESYTASARVRRALSRRLAGYAEALFFHYAFDDAALRPPGIPQTFDRVAVRCGLSLWVPLGQ